MTPSNRIEMVMYLTGVSSSMQMLCRLILRHYIQNREKMIIWCNEPLSQLSVELLLAILELPFACIRAGIKNSQRVKAELDYNSSTHDVGILVCSSRSAQESMNLQKGGHVQVFMDVVSATAMLQCIGRSHRIGQLAGVIVYRITVDETNHQVLQAAYQQRFRVLVAGQSVIRSDHARVLVQRLAPSERTAAEQYVGADPMTYTKEDYALNKLRGPYADAVIRELFGQRSNRGESWTNVYNPCAKNTQPEEIIYRLTLGGVVAEECAQQVREKNQPTQRPKDKPPPMSDAEERDPAFRPAQVPSAFAQPSMYIADPPKLLPLDAARMIVDAAKELASRVEYAANRLGPFRTFPFSITRIELPVGHSVLLFNNDTC